MNCAPVKLYQACTGEYCEPRIFGLTTVFCLSWPRLYVLCWSRTCGIQKLFNNLFVAINLYAPALNYSEANLKLWVGFFVGNTLNTTGHIEIYLRLYFKA